ncbi:hypothetical protein SAMN04488063_1771 [Halopelagius inordinatus]|uniref:Apea-like HEPN domain-containing protein n=1 Tax=Halopelagius inordinatus TaxID=553467 RepID=A0A1I2R367_9EURY|nr:hypothetical protein [Halopelagius inordinatus]SFG35114.1 hypothetical protein SAMN04488063_1771 [Halopelagius inordinatus]
MDADIKVLIEKASKLIDEDGRSSFKHADRVSTLIALIIEDLDFPRRKFGLSEQAFERHLRQKIGQIDTKGEIDSEFYDLLGELKKELGTSEEVEYSVVFALPIKFPNQRDDRVFEYHGIEIKQISQSVWEDDFLEIARNDASFEIQLTKSPYQLPDDGSFWKTETTAIDPDFALERTRFALKTLLGEINFLEHYGYVKNYHEPTSHPWPRGWSDILLPFALLLFQEGKFVKEDFSEDARPRTVVEVTEEVVDNIGDLPTFTGESYEVDQYLISGIHFFFSGITNANRTGAFLDFWRGLETLTLSSPGDTSSDITERAITTVIPDEEDLFGKHVDSLVNTRNNLVHGDLSVDISQANINLLKDIHESLINLYMRRRDKWTVSDIRFVLHECDIDKTDRLQQQRNARMQNCERIEREIEILDELMTEWE